MRTTVLPILLIAPAVALALNLTRTAALCAEAAAAGANRIEAEAVNLRNSSGTLRCELFNGPKGFPRKDDSVVGTAFSPIKDSHAACVFRGVAPGSYAVAAMHDENGNEKMDYNFFGIPIEGYGFSNGAIGFAGAPPSFEGAEFQYTGGVMRVPIKLRY